MITVTIIINSELAISNSATNLNQKQGDDDVYVDMRGNLLLHNPQDGVVELAREILNAIPPELVESLPKGRR